MKGDDEGFYDVMVRLGYWGRMKIGIYSGGVNDLDSTYMAFGSRTLHFIQQGQEVGTRRIRRSELEVGNFSSNIHLLHHVVPSWHGLFSNRNVRMSFGHRSP